MSKNIVLKDRHTSDTQSGLLSFARAKLKMEFFFFEKISKCQIFPDIVFFRAFCAQMQRFTLESESKKSRKFSKCQIFPDIVVFRAKVEKMTLFFTQENLGMTPPYIMGREYPAPKPL